MPRIVEIYRANIIKKKQITTFVYEAGGYDKLRFIVQI